MKNCPFCDPDGFGQRKLRLESKYWYLILPQEVGSFCQVSLVVRRLPEDPRHITDISDSLLSSNNARLVSVIDGIHRVASLLKEKLKDENGREVGKVYLVSECENDSHLHFNLYPRYEGDRKGNEFLYACELKEARWISPDQDTPCKLPPRQRIANGRKLLDEHGKMLADNTWHLSDPEKNECRKVMIQILNEILPSTLPKSET